MQRGRILLFRGARTDEDAGSGERRDSTVLSFCNEQVVISKTRVQSQVPPEAPDRAIR